MTLTPEAVRNKQFTPTRFRPGYDEDEVDVFLDEVETELTRLLEENADLRAQLQASPAKAAVAEPAPQPAEPAEPPPPRPPAEEPGAVALRTLQMAQRTAEEAVAQAQAEADSIVGEARERATRLEEEAQRQRIATIADLDRRRTRLQVEVEELRAFEQEYRSRLRAYFESQLRALEDEEEVAPGLPPGSEDGDEFDVLPDGAELDTPAPSQGGGRHRNVQPGDGPAAAAQPPEPPAQQDPPAPAAEDEPAPEPVASEAPASPPTPAAAASPPTAEMETDEGPEPASS